MATHMLRQFARRAVYAHPLLRRQSIRLVSSSPRVIFAGNKCLQQPFLVSSSLAAKPPSLMGVRLFADAGAALSREEIQTRVMDVLKLFDKVEPEKLTHKSHFINDLGLDSLDIVEIVMALEDDFAIEISDEEAEKVFTVDDAVQLIAKALDEH